MGWGGGGGGGTSSRRRVPRRGGEGSTAAPAARLLMLLTPRALPSSRRRDTCSWTSGYTRTCGPEREGGGRRLQSGRVPRIGEVASVRERVRLRSVTKRCTCKIRRRSSLARLRRRSDHELHHMSLQASWQRAPVSWRGAASVRGEPLTCSPGLALLRNSAVHKTNSAPLPYPTPITLSVLYRRL